MPMYSLKLLKTIPPKTASSACLIALVLTCTPSRAVELEQLHIPKTYLRYLPQMLDGAKLMEATEKCVKFLSGKVHLDSSSPDHPIFVYTCRAENLDTYRWRVDGLSLSILDDTRAGGSISFAELQAEIEAERAHQRALEAKRQEEMAKIQAQRADIERQRQEEQARRDAIAREIKEKQRRSELWTACLEKWRYQTQNMTNVELLTTQEPEAQVLSDASTDIDTDKQSEKVVDELSDENQDPATTPMTEQESETQAFVRFTFDFDAEDYYGAPLQYRGHCDAQNRENLSLSIHPRSLASSE